MEGSTTNEAKRARGAAGIPAIRVHRGHTLAVNRSTCRLGTAAGAGLPRRVDRALRVLHACALDQGAVALEANR
jgi:hypothetical protein